MTPQNSLVHASGDPCEEKVLEALVGSTFGMGSGGPVKGETAAPRRSWGADVREQASCWKMGTHVP